MIIKRKKEFGWILYDFANSSYHLIIPTIIMPLYFRQYLAVGSNKPDLYWGIIVSLPVLVAGLVGPFLGAYADIYNRRLHVLLKSAIAAIIFISFVPAFRPGIMGLGTWAFILSYFFFILSLGIYDSFLPLVTEKTRKGTLSGLAWGVGYLGGILALAFIYPILGNATLPEGVKAYNMAIWITCIIYALFSLVSFSFLKHVSKEHKPDVRNIIIFRLTVKKVLGTIREWRNNPNLFRTLISYYLANDGLATLVYFTSIYAATTLGFNNRQILLLFLIVQIVGIPSSIIGGILADRIGHKRILYSVLGLWVILCILFAIGRGLSFFYLLSIGTGLVIGTTPAVYRSFLAEFIPMDRVAELYGFNSFASRASSVLGPILFGLVASVTGSQRIAMLSLLLFFGIAAILLRPIKSPLAINDG